MFCRLPIGPFVSLLKFYLFIYLFIKIILRVSMMPGKGQVAERQEKKAEE